MVGPYFDAVRINLMFTARYASEHFGETLHGKIEKHCKKEGALRCASVWGLVNAKFIGSEGELYAAVHNKISNVFVHFLVTIRVF